MTVTKRVFKGEPLYRYIKVSIIIYQGYWTAGQCASRPQTEPDCFHGCNSENTKITSSQILKLQILYFKSILNVAINGYISSPWDPGDWPLVLCLGSCERREDLGCGSTSGLKSWSTQSTERGTYGMTLKRKSGGNWTQGLFLHENRSSKPSRHFVDQPV